MSQKIDLKALRKVCEENGLNYDDVVSAIRLNNKAITDLQKISLKLLQFKPEVDDKTTDLVPVSGALVGFVAQFMEIGEPKYLFDLLEFVSGLMTQCVQEIGTPAEQFEFMVAMNKFFPREE